MGAIHQALLSIGGGGGGGAFTPSDIASIWEWWEVWREGLADNDAMAQLTGQENARHWVQSTALNKPIYKTNQINSLAAARFAGDPVHFTGPDMSALTEGHIFLIVKIDNDPPGSSAASGLWRIGTDGSQNDHYPFTDGTVYMGPGTNSRVTTSNPAMALTSWHVLEVVTKSNDYRIILNGVTELYNVTSATIAYTSTPNLGRSISTPYLQGYIAGMYMFSARLTSGGADRNNMVSYINSTFGLSMS